VKIFQIHNRYKFYGGEDAVVDEEYKLLKKNNHKVYKIVRNNSEEIKSLTDMFLTLKNLSFSNKSINILKNYLKKYGKPDVVHIHNIFPLWTYSIFDLLEKEDIPIVLTLHNYRIIFHKLNFFNLDLIKYNYFKNSRVISFIISKLFNRNFKLLSNVDMFITHTKFTKKIFLNNGLSNEKLMIKPNFINEYLSKPVDNKKKSRALYAARLSKEKGLITLLKAAKKIDLKIDILGDGPLKGLVNKNDKDIKYHGNLSRKKVIQFISKSKFLIYPSEWFEIFGMTIIEAFSLNTLVLASDIGSIKHIIRDKENGLLFKHGDEHDLIKKIKWINSHPKECEQIVINAKKDFLKKYSPKKNYQKLIKIYEQAIFKKSKNH